MRRQKAARLRPALRVKIMSIEPQLKSENFWAAVRGAMASTAVIFVVLVTSVFFIPSSPEDDGHIRGAAIVVGFLPLVMGIFFVYYLVLSAKENRPIRFALLVQTVIIGPLAAFVFYMALQSSGLFVAVLNSFYTFAFFSIVGAFGSWAWSKSKKT